ncbi:hypothetical protein PG984_012722 [Apiospora sp. TS-2023a]
MLSLRLIAILAFSALVSSTSNAVDCEVTTDFQDPSLQAAILNANLPTTAAENLVNPNKYALVSEGTDTTLLVRLAADTGFGFSQLKLEQYATFCVARTDNTLVAYLMDCTVEVFDSSDFSIPPSTPTGTLRRRGSICPR